MPEDLRTRAERHAQGVVGDMDLERLVADLDERVRPLVPDLLAGLPQPVTSARIVAFEGDDRRATATTRYTGQTGSLTVRSHWEVGSDGPRIIEVTPAADDGTHP